VLQPERHLEAGRAEGAPADPLAVRLIDRGREERLVQGPQGVEALDPGLLRQGERFAEAFYHGREQKVAGELQEVRPARLLPDDGETATERLQDRPRRLERLARSGRDHPEL